MVLEDDVVGVLEAEDAQDAVQDPTPFTVEH